MKKIFLAVVMSVMTATMVSAQNKGKWELGANVAFQTDGSNFGIGAKGRYGITEQIRLDGDITYFFPQDHVSGTELVVNGHYLFPLSNSKFTLYPLVGLGYYNSSVKVLGIRVSSGDFMFDFGGGADYQLNNKCSVGVEAKYYVINGLSTPALSVNVMFSL